MPHITTTDLQDLGFSQTQYPGSEMGVTRWAGHRLSVEHSAKHIRIKMQGCGCPLVQMPVYRRDQLVGLLYAIAPVEEA
jgi:hypothetical protein